MSTKNKIMNNGKVYSKIWLSIILITAINSCAVRGKLTLPSEEKKTTNSSINDNQKVIH